MARTKKVRENDQPSAESPANDLLIAKLRAKFSLLKDEPLNFDDKDKLLDHVCVVLGMNRPQLDWIVAEL